jgi:regulator of RNase E activity RraA
MVIIQQDDGANSAVMGGVISARAHAIGVAGFVVDGRVRDLEEHRAVGLPVFARTTSVLCPATRNIVYGIPVEICGKLINPGDCVVADSDGVVHFDPSLLDQVIDGVPKILETENKVREAVLEGISVTEAHRMYKPHLVV